ncbi:MAG: dTDP-4-dehydrorhamnose reductase [Candidatus Latescibacterota bacterium]|jgi:dTDP-4-dehydrorhamnose reductase
MPRLLLTGLSGFLGGNIARLAPAGWHIIGTVRTRTIELPGVESRRLDLCDTAAVEQLFIEAAPDAVLHVAARTDPNYCELHRAEAWRHNVEVSAVLAALCAQREIPMVYTSTDLVFDGSRAPYKEQDEPQPANIYGASKAEGERQIRVVYPAACICRMPLMFGLAQPQTTSFVQPMIEEARRGGELSLFTDEYRTPASARAAVQGLFLALEKGAGEILHLGGGERISRCDFGYMLMRVFSLPAAAIVPRLQKDVPMAAPRARDVSLDNAKAKALGYEPWSLLEELELLRSES